MLYAAHDFPEAAKLYSFAIEKNPNDATIWCNRAATRIKIEEHGYALSDACMSFLLLVDELCADIV